MTAFATLNGCIPTLNTSYQVNAAYAPSVNSLWVPVGILRPPFLHADVAAVRYGSLGQILGHELTHGFDNTGAQFDKGSGLDGSVNNGKLAKCATYLNSKIFGQLHCVKGGIDCKLST